MKELIIDGIREEDIKKLLWKKRNGIKTYLWLMEKFSSCDKISECDEFKDKYRSFYRMNRCHFTEYFYDTYFKYLEENKSKSIEFGTILEYLFYHPNSSKRVEASFSSKLLATINPNRAVWDTNVLSRLTISRPQSQDDKAKQIEKTIEVYKKLEDNLKNYDKREECIRVFDEVFKEELKDNNFEIITPIKKVDLVLWSLGKKSN